jgi:hypothetical protein
VRLRTAAAAGAAALAAIHSEGIEGRESTFETRPRSAGEMRDVLLVELLLDDAEE